MSSCSTAKRPAGAQQGRRSGRSAAGSPSSPSVPPKTAMCGSCSVTSARQAGGADLRHVRRVGQHQVDRAVQVGQHRRVGGVARDQSTGTPVRSVGVAAQPASAAGSHSTGRTTRAGGRLGRDRQRRSRPSRRTGPPPARRAGRRSQRQRPLDQHLGLGPRHEDAGPTASSRCRNGAVPVRCCSGTRRARSLDQARGTGRRWSAVEVPAAPAAAPRGTPSTKRGEQLGVHPRRRDVGRRQRGRRLGHRIRAPASARSPFPPVSRSCGGCGEAT